MGNKILVQNRAAHEMRGIRLDHLWTINKKFDPLGPNISLYNSFFNVIEGPLLMEVKEQSRLTLRNRDLSWQI